MSYENHEEKWSTTSNWVCQPSHTKSRVSYPRRRVCTNQPIQLVPCWMPKPLPPRNQCTGCFAPALWDIRGLVGKSNHLPPYLFNSPIASDGNVDKIYLLQWYKDCESNFFSLPFSVLPHNNHAALSGACRSWDQIYGSWYDCLQTMAHWTFTWHPPLSLLQEFSKFACRKARQLDHSSPQSN